MIAPTEDEVGEGTELSVDGNGEEAEPVKHAADPGAPQPLKWKITVRPTYRSGRGASGAS